MVADTGENLGHIAPRFQAMAIVLPPILHSRPVHLDYWQLHKQFLEACKKATVDQANDRATAYRQAIIYLTGPSNERMIRSSEADHAKNL